MKTLVIFMGPAGVGKSKLVKYIKKRHPQALVITKRDIELNFPKESREEQNKKYYENINNMLKIGEYIIVDSNHILRKDRIELFNSLNINPNDLNIIGVWIDNSWNHIIENNSSKPKNEQLDEKTLKYLFDYRSSPESDEPFNDIVYLSLSAKIGISKTHPCLTDVYTALDKI